MFYKFQNVVKNKIRRLINIKPKRARESLELRWEISLITQFPLLETAPAPSSASSDAQI